MCVENGRPGQTRAPGPGRGVDPGISALPVRSHKPPSRLFSAARHGGRRGEHEGNISHRNSWLGSPQFNGGAGCGSRQNAVGETGGLVPAETLGAHNSVPCIRRCSQRSTFSLSPVEKIKFGNVKNASRESPFSKLSQA
jgi:hypothetical protein